MLRSTPLTDEQIKEVVAQHHRRRVGARWPTARSPGDEIEAFIADVTHHDAGPENVRRVAAKLAAAGWPLAGLD